MRALPLICACVVVTLLTPARAEPRRTLEAVTLRKKPGEKEAVVAYLPANTQVKVISLEGRWLLVKAGNQTGYLTRTTVSEPTPPDVEPEVRWSAARQVDGKLVPELFVQVTAPRGALLKAPRTGAAPVAEVSRGARLTVVDAASDPAWIHAHDASGNDGWIARGQIDNGAASVVVTGVDLKGSGAGRATERDDAAAGPATPRGPLAVRAELGLGFRALGMNLTSNAEGGLTNYVLDAEAVAATLDVDIGLRLSDRLFIAADGRVVASDSSPGIEYPGPSAPAGKIPFRTYAGDLGVRVGTRARRVFDLALRLGGHYDTFLATDVKNAGMLPRERLVGATLGARVDIAPERSSFTITARFDALVIGSRAQTPGLEDGTSSTASALWGGLTMRYGLGRRLSLFGGYELARASTQWSGMSVRQPGVTSARRIDTAQLIQLGISTEL